MNISFGPKQQYQLDAISAIAGVLRNFRTLSDLNRPISTGKRFFL